MSTDSSCKIKSTSFEDTEKIGAQLGAKLQGGEVIELVSDLGGGKTVLARGLVHGGGNKEDVTSPTFTLSKIYKCKNFDIHHFDFYRLDNAGVMKFEIKELLHDKKSVIVIEWAKAVTKILPKSRVKITIENKGENERLIKFSYPKNLAYLVEGLK